VEVGDGVDDRETHDQAAGHQRDDQRLPRQLLGVQVEAAEDHPGAVRQRDHQLAEAAIGPADRRRHVEDRGRAAEERKGEDRPAAQDRQVDPDGERACERGDAEPQDGVGHRRQIGGIEHPVRAHARVEILVEGLDADDREHHAGEPAEEDRAVERVGEGIGPGRAEQVGQQSCIEEEAVAHQGADTQHALPRRAAGPGPLCGRGAQR
jgi:hypothetical protein